MSSDCSDFIDMTERERSREVGVFLPSTNEVTVFLETLRSTKEYQSIVDRRYERVLRATSLSLAVIEEVTREEVAEVFEETEDFKSCFWDFTEDCVHLSYNPALRSARFVEAFDRYKHGVVVSMKSVENGEAKEVVREKDLERSRLHNAAAGILVEDGVVRSEFLGRIIVRAFLVDAGMDYIDSARRADLQRRLRDATDARTLIRAIEEDSHMNRQESVFSPARAKEIQEQFCQRGLSGPEVDRDLFRRKKTTSDYPILPFNYNAALSGERRRGDAENVRFPHIPDVSRD